MHPRYAPYLFNFFLTAMMSFLVTGVATVRVIGITPDFLRLWMSSWVSAWPVAFAASLAAAPLARRIVASIVRTA